MKLNWAVTAISIHPLILKCSYFPFVNMEMKEGKVVKTRQQIILITKSESQLFFYSQNNIKIICVSSAAAI